ncbi:MAG: SpoIIE family protein phosphatase [Flavobacteriales bacterium]|nr:SpoIIE family protein phosphatase [Flavobacteriales bacterium]
MRITTLPLFLFLVLQGASVVAQSGRASFDMRQHGEDLGLSSSYVIGTVECPDGRLLVATKAGVDLFDGRVFTPLLLDTVRIDNVTGINRNGDVIYLGLDNGDILSYSASGIRKLTIGLKNPVKFVLHRSDSVLLAIGRMGGLMVQRNGLTTVHPLFDDESLVNAVIALSDTRLLVGTNEGLFFVELNEDGAPKSIALCADVPDTRIISLWHDTAHALAWIGTEDAGLMRMTTADLPTSKAQRIVINESGTEEVHSVYIDHQDRIWLGLSGIGLKCIEAPYPDIKAETVQFLDDPSLQQHSIHGIIEDAEGTLWVSTFGGGLIQLLDRVFDHPFDADWLRQQRITRLFRDFSGQTWIGIDKGIFLANSVGGETQFTYFHLGGQTVTSINQSSNGNLWIGTESNGVYRKNPNSGQFTNLELPGGRLSNAVNAIVVEKDRVLVCTKGGLFVLDESGLVSKRVTSIDGLPHNNVLFALTDKDGNTWIANQGNRVSYFRDGTVRFLEERAAQSITDVYHMLEDKKGRLWFATLGSGVFVLDNGTTHQIGEDAGLPSMFCYQLEEDQDGSVWIRHQKSIAQISADLRVDRVIGHQHLSPVANTMITFLFKDTQGYLWVTSTHGVVRYDPQLDKTRRDTPKLSIIGMRLGDRPVKMLSNMSLPFEKYNITFDLSGISLRDPESIRYKYRLLGFSEGWSDEFTSHVINFPRIEDGSYTLEVMACKNGGEWTREPAKFSFVIEKPLWRTLPFYLFILLAIGAAVSGFVRYRTVKLTADKQALESLVSERTVEIQHQKEEIEKSRDEIARYAKDITDSIKYAQRIQSAIFPEWESLSAILPDSFVFFRSKDIVSGDFFFAERVGDLRIFAAVDCTGHGVPGGFMSIVANNLLNQAVKQMGLTRPSEILNYLNEGITNTLHQTYEESSVKDGLDIAVCTLNMKNRKLEFSGAYNPLYLFRNGQLTMVKGDRFPVGMSVGEESKSFTNNEMMLEKDDLIYIFSDGYADQFGGPKGKKLKLHGFRDLLTEIHTLPTNRQGELLALKLDDWMGDLDQVDDIVVIGVRIT